MANMMSYNKSYGCAQPYVTYTLRGGDLTYEVAILRQFASLVVT